MEIRKKKIYLFFLVFNVLLFIQKPAHASIINNPPKIKEHYDSVSEYYQDMKKVQKSHKSYKIDYDEISSLNSPYTPKTLSYIPIVLYLKNNKSLYTRGDDGSSVLSTPLKKYEWSSDNGVGITAYLFPLKDERVFNELFNWGDEINSDAKFQGVDKFYGLECRVIDYSTDQQIRKICINDKYGIPLYKSQDRILIYVDNREQKIKETIKTLRVKNIEVNQVKNSVFKPAKKRYISVVTLVLTGLYAMKFDDPEARDAHVKKLVEKQKLNKRISKLDELIFLSSVKTDSKKDLPQIQKSYSSVLEYYLDMKTVQEHYESFRIKYRYLSKNHFNKQYFFYLKYNEDRYLPLFALSDVISSKLLCNDKKCSEFYLDGKSGYIIYKAKRSSIRNRFKETDDKRFKEYDAFFDWYMMDDYIPKFSGETKVYNNISCRVINFYNNKNKDNIEVCVSDKYGIAVYSKQKVHTTTFRDDQPKPLKIFTMSIDEIEINNVDNSTFELSPDITLYENAQDWIQERKLNKTNKPVKKDEFYNDALEYIEAAKKIQKKYKSLKVDYVVGDVNKRRHDTIILKYPKIELLYNDKTIQLFWGWEDDKVNDAKIKEISGVIFNWWDRLKYGNNPKFTNEKEIYNGLPCRVIQFGKEDPAYYGSGRVCVSDEYGIAIELDNSWWVVNKIEANKVDDSDFKWK